MKIQSIINTMRQICCLALIVIFGAASSAQERQEDVYYRTAPHHPYRDFKFVRVNGDIEYITEISLSDLQKSLQAKRITRFDNRHQVAYNVEIEGEDGVTNSFRLEYFIMTSLEDTELYALDHIGQTVSWLTHGADLESEFTIGDNSWIDSNGNDITFTRNNVCVTMTSNDISDQLKGMVFAKAIDDYLVKVDKADTPDRLQVPVVSAVEIISFRDTEGNFRYDLSVTANDPESGILYYHAYGPSTSLRTDGTISFWCRTRESECKVWVMNDKHIVASKDIFLTPSGVNVEDNATVTPQVFTLFQNAPNPFNQATYIRYELKRPGYVYLSVYDTLGREVAQLEEGHFATGSHHVMWDGTNNAGNAVSSGIYFYRLTISGHVESRRMTLVR